MNDKQVQRAGQGAQQIQVSGGGDVYVLQSSLTEERVWEIAEAASREVAAQHVQEGRETIERRIEELNARVIPLLSEQGALDAFADPAFQRTFTKAQNGAAASERGADYDLLASLLADRAQDLRDRNTMVAVDRAAEIVDQMDEQALNAIMAVECIRMWTPNIIPVDEGLASYEDLLHDLIIGPLPEGNAWIDHLDILDAVRTNHFGLRRFDEYFGEKFNGYTAPGVEVADAPTRIGGEQGSIEWRGLVIEHELMPGRVRIGASSLPNFRRHLVLDGHSASLITQIVQEASDVFGLGTVDTSARDALMERAMQYPTIGTICEWWNEIPTGVQLTAVGRVIARANMHRLDGDQRLPRPGEDAFEKRLAAQQVDSEN